MTSCPHLVDLKDHGVPLTCCKHQLRLDHLHSVRAKLLKIRDAPGVAESADVDVGNLQADGETLEQEPVSDSKAG